MRQNGTALLSSPIPENATQAVLVPGILMPRAITSTFKITAANPTRRNTIVKGGNVLIRTAAKKNEPPHRTDSNRSASHSPPFMRWLIRASPVIYFSLPVDAGDPRRLREFQREA